MRHGVGLALAWCLGAAALLAAPSPTFDAATYVRELHERYLGRAPTAEESGYWVSQMRAGTLPAAVHAGIIGSEAFFALNNRNPSQWLNATFGKLLGRAPAANESKSWLERYRLLNGNRTELAAELLRAAGSQAPAPAAAAAAGSASPADLPDRLVTTSQLVVQAVTSELPGSADWLVKVQANTLLAAARSGRSPLADPARDPGAAATAHQNISAAMQGLQQGLGNVKQAAPLTRLYVNQAAEIVAALAPKLSVTTARPSPTAPLTVIKPVAGAERIDAKTFESCRALLDTLVRSEQQTVTLLRGSSQRTYDYLRLLNDSELLVARTESLRATLAVNSSLGELRTSLTSLSQQALEISEQMQRAKPDGRVVQSWYETVLALNTVLEFTGGTSPAAPAAAPTATPPTSLNNRLAMAATSGVAQCDALVVGFDPFAFYSADVPKLQADFRQLRNLMETMRQSAQQGAPPQELTRQWKQIEAAMAGINPRWAATVRTISVANVPDLSGLSSAIELMSRAMSGMS